MLFSHVKISSFCAKAHLVYHWCLYNKLCSWNNKGNIHVIYFFSFSLSENYVLVYAGNGIWTKPLKWWIAYLEALGNRIRKIQNSKTLMLLDRMFRLHGFVSCSPESCKVSVISINCSHFSLQDMYLIKAHTVFIQMSAQPRIRAHLA